MAWRFVRQPDGKLARWSDIVDAFTHYDLDEPDAIGVALSDCGLGAALSKIKRAQDDEEPWKEGVKGDGLSRWRDCVETMERVHVPEQARKNLAEMGFADWKPAPSEARPS